MNSACVALDQLRVNPDWAKLPLFDRKGWKRVRFGDVVENLNETERDPAGTGIERFIAMEHLEPGSLHIRDWGKVADGTTFNRRCRPGQVLFGKRRAYQRKVAVAEFDAVVSGDIYVFAPKGDRLLPEKEADPEEERNKAKEALTELFTEAKSGNTHIIVERIVADIDDIVKKVRFPDWQHTTQGERLVQKELRKTLLKY